MESKVIRIVNLDDKTTEKSLKEFIEQYIGLGGQIQNIFVSKDEILQLVFAYVVFQYIFDARKAIHKLNGFYYNTLYLEVEFIGPSCEYKVYGEYNAKTGLSSTLKCRAAVSSQKANNINNANRLQIFSQNNNRSKLPTSVNNGWPGLSSTSTEGRSTISPLKAYNTNTSKPGVIFSRNNINRSSLSTLVNNAKTGLSNTSAHSTVSSQKSYNTNTTKPGVISSQSNISRSSLSTLVNNAKTGLSNTSAHSTVSSQKSYNTNTTKTGVISSQSNNSRFSLSTLVNNTKTGLSNTSAHSTVSSQKSYNTSTTKPGVISSQSNNSRSSFSISVNSAKTGLTSTSDHSTRYLQKAYNTTTPRPGAILSQMSINRSSISKINATNNELSNVKPTLSYQHPPYSPNNAAADKGMVEQPASPILVMSNGTANSSFYGMHNNPQKSSASVSKPKKDKNCVIS